MAGLEAIVAVYGDWGIGADGTQPVTVSADRKHFRDLTMGAAVIVGRSLNVAQTESYIERLLAQAQVTPPQSRPTYIIKDVRLFLNSIDRSLQMIRQCGVDADLGRRDTDSEILLTIRIPKQRAVRPS